MPWKWRKKIIEIGSKVISVAVIITAVALIVKAIFGIPS